MKITKVEAIGVSRYLFARVHTDEGITGLGESGAWGYLEASKAAIELFGRYLVGQDPTSNRAPLAVHVPILPLQGRSHHGRP